LQRRTIVLAVLAVYLAASSLFYLGGPRILRVRLGRTRSPDGRPGVLVGVQVLPPIVGETDLGVGFMAPFRLDTDPRGIMEATEDTLDNIGPPPRAWSCDEGVVFWSEEGHRHVEYSIRSFGFLCDWNWVGQDYTSAQSFGATVWSGDRLWVEEDIGVGETRAVTPGGSVVGIFVPGVFILGLAVAVWPLALLFIGLSVAYWLVSSKGIEQAREHRYPPQLNRLDRPNRDSSE